MIINQFRLQFNHIGGVYQLFDHFFIFPYGFIITVFETQLWKMTLFFQFHTGMACICYLFNAGGKGNQILIVLSLNYQLDTVC